MKDKNTMDELKERYLSVDIPKQGLQEMKNKIDMARMEKKRRGRFQRFKLSGIAVAAAALAFVILPNTNADIAMAMSKMPVIGRIVNVVTIDKYIYENENNNANVDIPQINVAEGTDAANQVNKDVKEYTDMLIKQFEKDSLDYKEGHKGLDVSWDVISNTEEWFTLRINILEIQASGYEHYEFYHINKLTGEITELKELFVNGADYMSIISDNIKTQMRTQMQDEEMTYFIDSEDNIVDNFESIKENQHFYFNADNELVIVFDEYEVAPGYMGSVEFVIENEVIKDILK